MGFDRRRSRAVHVRLTMQVEDRKGMLAEISAKVSTSTQTSRTWRRGPATTNPRASR
jgi:hypothetical protein